MKHSVWSECFWVKARFCPVLEDPPCSRCSLLFYQPPSPLALFLPPAVSRLCFSSFFLSIQPFNFCLSLSHSHHHVCFPFLFLWWLSPHLPKPPRSIRSCLLFVFGSFSVRNLCRWTHPPFSLLLLQFTSLSLFWRGPGSEPCRTVCPKRHRQQYINIYMYLWFLESYIANIHCGDEVCYYLDSLRDIRSIKCCKLLSVGWKREYSFINLNNCHYKMINDTSFLRVLWQKISNIHI